MTRNKYPFREFVYLDDETAINHLASSGEGIPEEMTEVDGEEASRSFHAGMNLVRDASFGFGRNQVTTEGIETALKIESPFVFHRLEKIIKREFDTEDGYTLFSGTGFSREDINRGDPVEVDGTLHPLSLSKFALGVQSISELEGINEVEVLERVDRSDERRWFKPTREVDQEFPLHRWLLNQYTDGTVPAKIVPDRGLEKDPFYTALRLDKLWLDPRTIFASEKSYTLFGRVESTLGRDEQWDPVKAVESIGEFFNDGDHIDRFRKAVVETGKKLGVRIEEDDMYGDSGVAVVHPIAVYW